MNMHIQGSPEGVKVTIDKQVLHIPTLMLPYLLAALADVNLNFHKMQTLETPVETVMH
jgi:hypothetical protein